MFPKAKTLEYFGLWGNDGSIVDYNKKFSKDIEIIKTPGHNYDGLTLLVTVEPSSTPGVKESEHPRGVSGQVAICGDVFWKENYPKKDPYASDPIALEVSRKKVLKLANYVIPGHGEIFSTKKCD
jgi:glyoxylase-like metal-dependent hydrolase (beta-lactamase superfamily II)